jgi:hypothetical protein
MPVLKPLVATFAGASMGFAAHGTWLPIGLLLAFGGLRTVDAWGARRSRERREAALFGGAVSLAKEGVPVDVADALRAQMGTGSSAPLPDDVSRADGGLATSPRGQGAEESP